MLRIRMVTAEDGGERVSARMLADVSPDAVGSRGPPDRSGLDDDPDGELGIAGVLGRVLQLVTRNERRSQAIFLTL